MQDKQRAIVDWMTEVMKRRELSPRAWAERAKLGKDTVSRAIKPSYEFVTSTTTLAKLAEAVGEKPPGAAAGVPSAASLGSILTTMLVALGGEQKTDPAVIAELSQALRDTLLHLADEPEAADDPKVVQALARASLRSLARQSA